jgi:hypothetical protein
VARLRVEQGEGFSQQHLPLGFRVSEASAAKCFEVGRRYGWCDPASIDQLGPMDSVEVAWGLGFGS